MLPYKLLFMVAQNTLYSRVPACGASLIVEHEDGIIFDALDQHMKALFGFPLHFFCSLAHGDIADVALNDLFAAFLINVADKLDFAPHATFGFQWHVFVTDVAFLLQFMKRDSARFLILEKTDFREALPEEFVSRVAQQLHHEWIHVGDFSGVCIEKKYAIS